MIADVCSQELFRKPALKFWKEKIATVSDIWVKCRGCVFLANVLLSSYLLLESAEKPKLLF